MTGRRVAVTTAPGEAADRLCRLLREAGHVPVPLPCIAVAPSPPAVTRRLREAAESADWLVLTSRRAVAAVWPTGGMPDRPAVAAVGPRTAAAAREAGGRVEIAGRGGAAELREDLAGRTAGRRVVFPHSRIADPETAAFLRAEGAELVALPAYDTTPIPPAGDLVDAAVFGSPSAVTGWGLGRSFAGILCVAMGETTRAALVSAGAPIVAMPEEPGYDAIVHLIERSST